MASDADEFLASVARLTVAWIVLAVLQAAGAVYFALERPSGTLSYLVAAVFVAGVLKNTLFTYAGVTYNAEQ